VWTTGVEEFGELFFVDFFVLTFLFQLTVSIYSPFGAVLLMGCREVMFWRQHKFECFKSFHVIVRFMLLVFLIIYHRTTHRLRALYHIKRLSTTFPSSATSKLEEREGEESWRAEVLAFLSSARIDEEKCCRRIMASVNLLLLCTTTTFDC